MASRWIRSRSGKRVLDLGVALPALVVTSPLALCVAVAVRVKLGTPVCFRQERSGLSGATVCVPKFRSMTNDCDDLGNPLPDADRLTRFGRALRSSSLDELPQLWTVIRGEMSLVGPRPLPTSYLDRYSPEQRRRLEAKPGITGWAQINGRNLTTWPERFALDTWYVDNASLRLDLKILLRTVTIAIARQGVVAEDHATMYEFTGET